MLDFGVVLIINLLVNLFIVVIKVRLKKVFGLFVCLGGFDGVDCVLDLEFLWWCIIVIC